MPRKNKTERIGEYIRNYGYPRPPENSSPLVNVEVNVRGQDGQLSPTDLHIEIDLPGTEHTAQLAVATNDEYHSCPCHKLVAFCFFEWKDGEWILAPMIDGENKTRFITIGNVDVIDSKINFPGLNKPVTPAASIIEK